MSDLIQQGFSRHLVPPQGTGANGVLILGEAPGEQEDAFLQPFYPGAPAGSVIERAIRRAGYNRDQFVVTNVVPWRPPNNWLEGAPYEHEAVALGKVELEKCLDKYKPRCIVALGGVAIRATTGLAGPKLGVRSLAGFVLPSHYGIPVVAAFHPSYLRRGAMGLFGTLMRALRLANQVAAEGRKPLTPPYDNPPAGYKMYPSERDALDFECAVKSGAWSHLAYDIETPYSTEEDSAEESEHGDARTIKSVQFSLTKGSGIFMPWRSPFVDTIRRILGTPIPKLNWNGWRFDNPVLESNGCRIAGPNHDLMWAWHHAQPDIPRGLQFAAAQLGWPWPWKHLDSAQPQFYGIVDVDVLQTIA